VTCADCATDQFRKVAPFGQNTTASFLFQTLLLAAAAALPPLLLSAVVVCVACAEQNACFVVCSLDDRRNFCGVARATQVLWSRTFVWGKRNRAILIPHPHPAQTKFQNRARTPRLLLLLLLFITRKIILFQI